MLASSLRFDADQRREYLWQGDHFGDHLVRKERRMWLPASVGDFVIEKRATATHLVPKGGRRQRSIWM